MNHRMMQEFCIGLSDLLSDSARLAEAKEEIARLREALQPLAGCHLPPEGFKQRGVTAHFTTDQIIAAKAAMTPNMELTGRAKTPETNNHHAGRAPG